MEDKVDLLPLMHAFRLVRERHSRTILLLVGGDATGYSAVVRDVAHAFGVADHVIMRMNPPLSLIPLYYNAADVFVAPTDNVQETFGQVLVEAMASACPVVAADWDGYRGSIQHGKTGFLVPTRGPRTFPQLEDLQGIGPWQFEHALLSQVTTVDIDALAKNISQALDPCVGHMLGQAALAHAKANFDWRVVIGKYDDLWMTLASAPRCDRESRDVARPDYLQMFAGYWSELVSADSVVTAGPEAGRTGIEALYRYIPEMQHVVPITVAEAVVQAATRRQRALGEISRELGIGLAQIELCALWLAKHGHIRFIRELDQTHSDVDARVVASGSHRRGKPVSAVGMQSLVQTESGLPRDAISGSA